MNSKGLGRLYKQMLDQKGDHMYAEGTSVPADAATGYAKGCRFIKTDGGIATTEYLNDGDETSADFNALTSSIIQQAGADQADQGALTAAALTDNGGGAAADGTIAAITNSANAGSADVVPVADEIKELSDQVNKLIADNLAQDVLLTAIRTALVNTGVIKGAA